MIKHLSNKTIFKPIGNLCQPPFYCQSLANGCFENSAFGIPPKPSLGSKNSINSAWRGKSSLTKFGPYLCALLNKSFGTQSNRPAYKNPALGLGCLLALSLPTESLTNSKTMDTLDKIIVTDKLSIATTANETFFEDGHIHGYGYDVARRYADHLGVTLSVHQFATYDDAMLAVQSGQVDMMVGNFTAQNSLSASCPTALNQGTDAQNISFSFAGRDKLYGNAKNYLCDSSTQKTNAQIAKFYKDDLLQGYSQMHFDKVMSEELPKYQHRIQTVADKYNHDWRLLTAIAYQESHLDPNATSPTGVQGIMMLTEETAKAMGVSDRTSPTQSIQGGAKYLQKLDERFADIPKDNRLFFVLAAYNMGPNAVSRIQNIIKQQGGNPNSWSDFYGYLQKNKHKNSRYVQCLHYVTNIRAFFEEIKAKNFDNPMGRA